MSNGRLLRGFRKELGRASATLDGQPLPERFDLMRRSPSGFEWGYGGEGIERCK